MLLYSLLLVFICDIGFIYAFVHSYCRGAALNWLTVNVSDNVDSDKERMTEKSIELNFCDIYAFLSAIFWNLER